MRTVRRNSARLLALGLLTVCAGNRTPCAAAQSMPNTANRLPEISQTAPHSAAETLPGGIGKDGVLSPSLAMPPSNETLHIVVGHSLMLRSVKPLRRIYIGNPSVLQTYTAGQTEIVLTPRQGGVSSLIVWDTAGGELFYTIPPTSTRRACGRHCAMHFRDRRLPLRPATAKSISRELPSTMARRRPQRSWPCFSARTSSTRFASHRRSSSR